MKPVTFSIVRFLFVIFALSSINFAQEQVKRDGKTENELKALLKQLNKAQIEYDQTGLNKILASDYIEISPVGKLDLREKVLGFYSPEVRARDGNPQETVEADDFSIRIYGKFAVVIKRVTFLTKTSGQESRPPLSMRVTGFCRKEKGLWKITSAQYTIIKPPQIPPTESE